MSGRPVLAAVALLAVVFLMALPTGVSPVAGASHAAAPTNPHASLATAARSAHAIHPANGVIPNCQPPGYPFYGEVNQAWPITPAQNFQSPCGLIGQDEEHATLSSAVAYSAERWTIPVHLPSAPIAYAQGQSWAQSYVGMVVSGGDNFSFWHQSYAEVVFQSTGTGAASYSAIFHVFSLIYATYYSAATCPGVDLNFTWNDSYVCEIDELQNSGIASGSFPANDWVDVTFAGVKGSYSGTDIWVNDTNTTTDKMSTVLNGSTTGTGAYYPDYNSSCADACLLQWSMPFGLGFGFTLCPMSAAVGAYCNSYNQTRWQEVNPPEFGIPHFWSGSGYNGDYLYFAPESVSGVCNSNAPFGEVGNCYSQNSGTGTGYYPWFTYNGSAIDFGANWTWTTQNWGGAPFELLSDAAQHDLIPFYAYQTSNSSLAGFSRSGASIGVTVHLQDLGSITSANLNYSINGGAVTELPMAFANGSASDANYTATIPSGGDGQVNYTITAVDHAGALITDGPYRVARGPLPTFHIVVATDDLSCATVVVNGTRYANASVISTTPGYYSIHAQGCYPWTFSSWTLSRGLSIAPFGALYGTITVTASGTLYAHWTYVRPTDMILIQTNPITCGQVILNGQYYSSGTLASVLDAGNYSISTLGCAGKSFSGWSVTSDNASQPLDVLGGYLTPFGNGTLTANYINGSTADSLIFDTNPTTCGGISYGGAGYSNGEQVAVDAGTYAIAPQPCSHWGWRSWSTTGGLSVSGNTLTVNGGGILTENNYVLTEITFVTNPTWCGNITYNGVVYHNGDVLVVANNSTGIVYASPCNGYYLFGITGTGGITVSGNTATVNGSGDILATFIQGSPTQFLAFLTDPSTCGAIVFDGVRYVNSNYTYVAPGRVATLASQPCNAYGFVKWVTYGFVTVVGNTAYLNGSGALEAVFRPLAAVFLYTTPQGCGSINVAGTNYSSNSSVELTEYVTYRLAAYPCAGYAFTGWVNTTDAQLGPGTLTVTNQALLTANFAPIRYAVTVIVQPAACGSVRIDGVNDVNGTVLSLSGGTYSVVASPCLGNHLVNWSLTGGISVSNTTMTVSGAGSLGADYEPVPPSITLNVSTSSFAGEAVPFGASVAVPVPPYTYNWTWVFGDGTTTTTPVNFTSHVYANPGQYKVSVTVTDPLHRSAGANGTISIVAQGLAQATALTPLAIGALALGVIAVAVAVLVALRRPRPPAPEGSSPPAAMSAATNEPVPEPGGPGAS